MNEQGRSFEARDRYLDQLAVAHAEGRIDDDEFDRRSQAALRTDDPPHLPPERPRRSRPMTRRVVLAGGAAVAALAAVTWITQGPPEPDPLSAERAFTGLTEAVDLSRFWGLEASLRTDGLTLIVTLHQVDYAMRYCDRVVALKAGKVVYDGPATGLEQKQLIDIYGPEFEDVFWEGAPK